MKKTYVRPVMEAEIFAANESVAACWTIACNVPYGIGYKEINGVTGYQEGEDQRLVVASSGCGRTHEAKGLEASEPVANAMWQPIEEVWNPELNWGFGGYETVYGDPYPVFHFSAKGGTGQHFCTIGSHNWAPNPNASN